MSVINVSDYPILVELIHNDVPIGTIEDEWGITQIYRINSVHFLNRTAQTWTAIIQDIQGRIFTLPINPQQEGTINIPTPQRPASAPLTWTLTFVEG